ncbi:hypothetical protein VQZ80_000519 [Salmonella enterica]|nr:hypothetical protein [Salmonella enterica]EKC2305729.1 hypothetical protein [Salmonella enterica]EKC2384358.1 hypothetical protein [Salmonella enterica]EKC2529727.1 hypothetical protein [Salmonella enterica]EKC2983903.1 hypothetical protein [Salmonella enterica]
MTRRSSGELEKMAAPDAPLYGINTADPQLILIAGGYPLFYKGKLVAWGKLGAR